MAQNIIAPWAELVPNVGPMTVADLLAYPEDGAWQYELVEGRLVRMSPTAGEHGMVSGKLHTALGVWVERHGLGTILDAETGFQVGDSTVLAPDISFVRADRIPAKGSAERKGFWKFAPDLVAEVVSPSQSRAEMEAKARAWLEAGAGLVWLIWTDREEVDVWRMAGTDAALQPQRIVTLTAADALDGLDVLPGFTYHLASLFA